MKKEIVEIKLQDLPQEADNAVISFWHYTEGDLIKRDDDLVDVLANEIPFSISSPASGKITKILFSEGERVQAGEIIAVIRKRPKLAVSKDE